MNGNGWPLALISRAVSVLALSLVLAWFAGTLGQVELEEKSKLSHEALLAQLREEANTPYWTSFVSVLIGTGLYVLAVEALALGVRALVRGVASGAQEAPARKVATLSR
jgi:hypothetical protein